MPRSRPPYPPEFREQMVALVRAGRSPESLSREFEPTAQTIGNWVKQADLDEGLRSDGLTTAERDELRRLRRENKQLRIEREILKKAHGYDAPMRVLVLTRKKSARVASVVPVDEDHDPVRGPGWKDG